MGASLGLFVKTNSDNIENTILVLFIYFLLSNWCFYLKKNPNMLIVFSLFSLFFITITINKHVLSNYFGEQFRKIIFKNKFE